MDLFLRHGAPHAPNGQDAKGRPVWRHVAPCSRCGGAGRLDYYRHIENGVCFKCGGTRISNHESIERLYTAEELAKLNATAAKKAARKAEKAAKAAAEKAAADEAAAAQRAAGLASDPLFLRLSEFVGESEFIADLRDKLRVRDLSERQIEAAEEAMGRIEAKRALIAAAAWVGQIGERIKIAGVVKAVRLIHEAEGYWDRDRWLASIQLDSGAMLKWFSSSPPPAREGERIAGSASVKAHSEYQGVKETLIKNPRWAA